MSGYPTFSGDTPTCVKCGHDGSSTLYRPTGECHRNGDEIIDSYAGTPNERLCRTCRRCGYHWDEAVVPRAAVRTEPEQ